MNRSTRARLRWAWPLAVAAGVVVAIGLCEWAGWPFLRGPLQSTLTERLDRPVALGDRFRLRLLGSIRLDTSGLRVGPPAGAGPGSPLGGDLVNARNAWLELPYSTVFALMRSGDDQAGAPAKQAPRITALRVGEVDASLKRLADGRANWIFATAPRDPSRPKTQLPQVDELVLQRGRVRYDDAVIKTLLEATVSTTEGAQADRRAAGLVIAGRGRHEERPFEFRATSSGVLPLVAPQDRSQPVPVTLRLSAAGTTVSFDGTATDLLSFRALDGAFAVAGPSLAASGDAAGLTLPTTEPYELKGRLSKSGAVWALKQASLHVGESRLGGQFSFDRRHAVPLLSGELNGSRLVLADLAPAFGARAQAAPNPKPPPGRVVPQREFDVPSLRRMNADVKLRLQRADLGDLFAQPLQPLQGELLLQDGVLKLTNLLARAAGGQVSGGASMDGRTPNPRWDIDFRWAGIELEQWLRPRDRAARETKPSGEKPGYISGRLGGHAELTGRGKSTAELIASLDGTVQAWVRNGSLSHLVVEAAGIDIAEALGLLITGDKRLPIHCAALRAKAGDGIVVPEVGIIDTGDSTIFATGSVSLAQEKLDLMIVTKPKDVSPVTLRSPVRIEGTFADPRVKLDARKLATKAGAAALLASIHPLAALVALFDPGEKEAVGGCEQTLQQLRDADGPRGARDAKAPRAGEAPKVAAARQPKDAASAPVRR